MNFLGAVKLSSIFQLEKANSIKAAFDFGALFLPLKVQPGRFKALRREPGTIEAILKARLKWTRNSKAADETSQKVESTIRSGVSFATFSKPKINFQSRFSSQEPRHQSSCSH